MRTTLTLRTAFLLTPMVIAPAQAANIQVQQNTFIKVTTDRPDAIYKVGENVAFRVTVAANAPSASGELAWKLTLDGAKLLKEGTVSLQAGTATVRGSLAQPGVLQLKVTRSHGYLAKPKGATSLPIMISQPGMGVHPNGLKESRWVIGNAALGFLALDMSAHDMPMERTPEDEARWKKFMGYPYIGSGDRMTYYYRQVFLGMIRGIDYMTSRPDWNRSAIISSGSSQGGGLALIAAALDARITAVVSVAPALGEHTGPLYGRPDAAPNNLIMGPDKKTPDPRIIAATAYYDTCNFARFVKVPVLMSCGLIDTACPPMTVLSIYNTLSCPKQIDLVPLLGHNRSRWFDALRNRFLAVHAGISEPAAKPPTSVNMGAPIFKP
jgi:cephalosporin-C deacetylase-like acetyl esterase